MEHNISATCYICGEVLKIERVNNYFLSCYVCCEKCVCSPETKKPKEKRNNFIQNDSIYIFFNVKIRHLLRNFFKPNVNIFELYIRKCFIL